MRLLPIHEKVGIFDYVDENGEGSMRNDKWDSSG